MISLDNNSYDINSYRIELGKYNCVIDNVKKSGISPRIYFDCNNFIIMLELVYDIELFKGIKINDSVVISKYLTDFMYYDEKGWLPMYDKDAKCIVKKIDENKFNILVDFNSLELDNIDKIIIDEIISF